MESKQIKDLPHDIMYEISTYLDSIKHSRNEFRYIGKISKTDFRYEMIKNIEKPTMLPNFVYQFTHYAGYRYAIKMDYRNGRGIRIEFLHNTDNQTTIIESVPCIVSRVRGTWFINYDRQIQRYLIDSTSNIMSV